MSNEVKTERMALVRRLQEQIDTAEAAIVAATELGTELQIPFVIGGKTYRPGLRVQAGTPTPEVAGDAPAGDDWDTSNEDWEDSKCW